MPWPLRRARAATPEDREPAGRGAAVQPPEGLPATPRTAVGRTGRAGIALGLALPAIFVVWMQGSVIGGAVLASGEVVVRGQPKEVQSLDGGVIAALLAAEGDRVAAGQVLMRLDPSLIEIETDIAEDRLADAVLRERRLDAEAAGARAPDFADLPEPVSGSDLARKIEGQRAVFDARRAVLDGQRAQLATRVEAAEAEIAAAEARIADLTGRLALARDERTRIADLVAGGLARRADLTPAEERVSSLTAQLAAERSARARADAAIRDARLEVVQAERRFRETAVTELRAVTLERAQMVLELARLATRRDRIALVAPADGIVHDIRFSTVGGVVAPGASVMQIVPVGEGVEFAVRIEPRAIDDVYVGQPAKVILSAFTGAKALELAGRVAQVPPAASTDPSTGLSHYRLTVEVPPQEIARLSSELVPGMPVEAFLSTADRSILSYLLSPLTDQLRRAFREG